MQPVPVTCRREFITASLKSNRRSFDCVDRFAINLAGSAISFPLPLVDFAKANEGPATDPKVFAEQQKKLQDEMQKRADEARKKLESQGGAPPASTR